MEATSPDVFPPDGPIGSACGRGSCGDAHGAEVKDLFDAWVFAARDAELALDAWASAPTPERATAHAVYRAALDREERAAEVLAIAAPSRHGSPVGDDRANGESAAAPRQGAVRPGGREQDKPRR
jgi:hypothetical protein